MLAIFSSCKRRFVPITDDLHAIWRCACRLLCLLSGVMAGNVVVADEMTAESLLVAYVEQVDEKHEDVSTALKVFKTGDFDQARELLEKATVADPALPPAGVLLTRMFIAAGQPSPARAELQRVTENHPLDPEAFLGIGELAIAENRFADAKLAISKAMDLAREKNLSEYRYKKMQYRIHLGLATLAGR